MLNPRLDQGDGAPAAAPADVPAPAEDEEGFKAPKKKKKSSKSKDEIPADGEALDLTVLKKRKKKKPTATDFDAKLAEAGVAGGATEDSGPAKVIDPVDAGDPVAGTGVWAESSEATITYPLLLHRFFVLLKAQHPDLAGGDGRLKSYKIPPPQVLREGNRKTIFANISEISKKMKRHDEHVTSFLFAELGTSGSVDGSRRLVIKGRFQQKQLENVLRRYIGMCATIPGVCEKEG